MSTASGVRKRRGTVRSSITRLLNRLAALEGKAAEPSTFDLAQDMAKRLSELDREFRKHHDQLIDLIDETDEDGLESAQNELDTHDDTIDDANMRIRQLLSISSSSANSPKRKVLSRQQSQLEKAVNVIREAVIPLTRTSDICLIRHYEERLQAHKTDLKELSAILLTMNLEDSDDLYTVQSALESLIFECDLMIKKLVVPDPPTSATPPTASDSKGVKLPKLEAPTFDGKLINWISFWQQFDVAIHSRSTLSDVEKLAYLRNSLKDGSAKGIIEGLSTSGDFYAEAIETLKARYDRPRLIHQSHVRMILETPSIKEGTGREIRRLHDTVQQHLRALKAMDCEPSGPFITSILELKLDASTNFEWQKFSQDLPGYPHYGKLLEF